jgi:hypothetical protein
MMIWAETDRPDYETMRACLLEFQGKLMVREEEAQKCGYHALEQACSNAWRSIESAAISLLGAIEHDG